ncbi:MAG TPA: hypothetical protein VET87_06285 [Rubrivivax sp.]|nr:hypothetical protein [Rubrivivax sp.]
MALPRHAHSRGLPLALASCALASAGVATAASPPRQPLEMASTAPDARALGLYPARAFSVGTVQMGVTPTSRQAAWYFRQETVAVPHAALPQASVERGVPAFAELARWAATRDAAAPIDYPPLIWLAAPQQLRAARLAPGGTAVSTAQGTLPLQLVPKLALNRSYVDAGTWAFFEARELSLRGTTTPEGFVARTLWPQDFRLGPMAPPLRALPAADPAEALRKLMREEPQGGARSPFAAMTLWQRPGEAADWSGRPVIGLMVNGAQGDDDEAHGGHFAIVTGRVQADGSIGEWLVNNFYSLDVESEKGILAAPLPLDNYLGDLNSGQGWYRPSTMLVAVLRDERAAALLQSALNRVFQQFYRHQLVYYHPHQNCASIRVDTLRALGWEVPARGPTSRVLAWAAYPFIAVKDLSIAKAELAFDYLRTDQTRLLPAAALEQAFASLWALGPGGAPADPGRLAQWLAQDLQALAFVRFPQFPSSRAFGHAPAVSTWEYRTLVPSDPAMVQIVPVPPRPFPAELRDPDLRPAPWTPADYATLVWGALGIVGLPWLLWRGWRRWRP